METDSRNEEKSQMREGCVFAMDIGTRSIIGMVGAMEGDKLCVLAIEKEEHGDRAMVDGQIQDIGQVARVAASVKKKLEDRAGFPLDRVYVAAAGRALQTQHASFEMELESAENIAEETVRLLETGALTRAEEEFEKEDISQENQYYLVGYTVKQYYLDKYPLTNLLGHKGKLLGVDVIATFLPAEVVESLYMSMQKAGMDVVGMTLEPIASMNAAIPQNLRLLNLVLVDIGAGTSDIAAARDGSICGYTMATVAGDEVTECLMKEYLVDFETAERLKICMKQEEDLEYTDVLGFAHTVSPEEVSKAAESTIQSMCRQIAERITEVNGGSPSAVFLVGGGSKLAGVRDCVAEYLGMDTARVALGGNNFAIHAFSNDYDIKDPEYSTPLGIAVSAGLNLIHDSFYIRLNGQRAKLFRSGKLSVRDILMMNGYGYKHMISRSGQNLKIEVDGRRLLIRGEYAIPAQLQLNGRAAGLSDIVKAGDEIIFVPACGGRDGSARLREVVSLEEKGLVTFEGSVIPVGTTARVNGNEASGDCPLKDGDSITVSRMLTAADAAKRYDIAGSLFINGVKADPEQRLRDGDSLSRLPEKQKESPIEKKTVIRPVSRAEVHITLNDKHMTLEKKADGQPYYLMDMLVMTGIDFSRPDGIIVLRVNGEAAGFQSELKDGDKVDIYWS